MLTSSTSRRIWLFYGVCLFALAWFGCGRDGASAPTACRGLEGSELASCCQEKPPDTPGCGSASPECLQQVRADNPTIDDACVECICVNCFEENQMMLEAGPTADAMMRCARRHLIDGDCLICEDAPCDRILGLNLMTSPCAEETLAACPGCECAGAMDLSCRSLDRCYDEELAGPEMPCAAVKVYGDCLATCPTCPRTACPPVTDGGTP